MTIRNALLAAGSIVALSALAGNALAAGSVQATANASVTVVSPTNLTKTQDMAFGTVTRPSTGTNTIVLSGVDDSVSKTGAGDASLVASTTSAAKFSLATVAAINYTTTQSLTFTQTGLTNIAAGNPVAGSGTLGTVPANGTQVLKIGGQFDISSATTAQAYTGTLTVTVNYN
ncbi:DUF4402 domain-containing protein [Phenylobacterium sp.]|jgi:cytolysin (calcineurin-like family phosphatase)|uniref:DUF4402 domain-containing protein n=1 Tax=Phenylobacterium sp. TaxID=1871053 RepID=UPI002E32AA01|nr:DUF4402 domain-containing protein [Phenylobacterium sp.]HEX3366170.1 DUF4402 domain-containing protein [Phenylobacterium sp.]